MRRILFLMFALVALIAPPAQAARVITLSPHLAELVCAAGACAQLVGTVKYSDYPEQVKSRPLIGDAFAVNLEAVLGLRPDLILAWDGGTAAQTVARLRDLGLKVEMIRTRTLQDIGLALLRIGALLGTEDAACAAEAAYRQQIDALRRRYAKAPLIRAMYQIEPDPIFTVNRDSPISQAMTLCGAQNVFDGNAQLAGPVGRESVLAADPDAILFGRLERAAEIRASWLRFPSLRAVRANNLIAVDADQLARATPRMAQGAAELCAALDGARARLESLR